MKKVPYHELCSCNPVNGGSGVCGCTMANVLVDVPDTETLMLQGWECPRCHTINAPFARKCDCI